MNKVKLIKITIYFYSLTSGDLGFMEPVFLKEGVNFI